MHTEIDDDRFRHSSNIKVITSEIWDTAVLVLLMGGIYEVHRWDGFMWYDIQTKFHEDCYKCSTWRFCLNNLRRCNVGITDRRDIWSAPSRWAQVPWYTYQVSWWLVQTFK
jgi:hypothetical protein